MEHGVKKGGDKASTDKRREKARPDSQAAAAAAAHRGRQAPKLAGDHADKGTLRQRQESSGETPDTRPFPRVAGGGRSIGRRVGAGSYYYYNYCLLPPSPRPRLVASQSGNFRMTANSLCCDGCCLCRADTRTCTKCTQQQTIVDNCSQYNFLSSLAYMVTIRKHILDISVSFFNVYTFHSYGTLSFKNAIHGYTYLFI